MDHLTASAIIEEAIRKSHDLDTRMCIAVVDTAGHLVAFTKMDDAWTGSVDIAIKKAKTAALFSMPCHLLDQASLPHIEQTNGGLVTFPGGVIVRDVSNNVIGAVGVSGSSVENDLAVAAAAAQHYGE